MSDTIQPEPAKNGPPATHLENEELDLGVGHEDELKTPRPAVVGFTGKHAELYAEALEKYGHEGSIDPEVEKRLKRKIDCRILPLLGICYFFYCTLCRLPIPSTLGCPR